MTLSDCVKYSLVSVGKTSLEAEVLAKRFLEHNHLDGNHELTSLGSFKTTYLCREDFQVDGFDASNLSDNDMREIAHDMAEVWTTSGLYWEYLRRYGENNNLPKYEALPEEKVDVHTT